MQHTFFAVFAQPGDAEAAIREIEHLGTHPGLAPRKNCAAIVHRGELSAEELHWGETAGRSGMATGAVFGGVLGAIVAAIVVGALGAGLAFPALLGGVLGAIFGGALGAIAASSSPDRTLAHLEAELAAGRTLVSVEAPGLTCEEDAEGIVRRHGGRVQRRHLV